MRVAASDRSSDGFNRDAEIEASLNELDAARPHLPAVRYEDLELRYFRTLCAAPRESAPFFGAVAEMIVESILYRQVRRLWVTRGDLTQRGMARRADRCHVWGRADT